MITDNTLDETITLLEALSVGEPIHQGTVGKLLSDFRRHRAAVNRALSPEDLSRSNIPATMVSTHNPIPRKKQAGTAKQIFRDVEDASPESLLSLLGIEI